MTTKMKMGGYCRMLNHLSVLFLILQITFVHGEDSLQSALNAVHRRQRAVDLNPYGRYEPKQNEYWQDDDITDYVDEMDEVPYSSFRERSTSTKPPRETPRLQHNYDVQRIRKPVEDYADFLEKYQVLAEEPIFPYKQVKRYNYNALGYNSIGLRKRARYPTVSYANRPLQSDANMEDAEVYLPYGNDYMYKSALERRVPFYPVTKRFPVAKRSSPDIIDEQHRTDPRVEKELNELFNSQRPKPTKSEPKQEKNVTKKPTVTVAKDPKSTQLTKENIKSKVKLEKGNVKKDSNLNKEIVGEEVNSTNGESSNEKPLQMKKKSVGWSDYFGIDRKKKSTNSGMDNEWLIERYNAATNTETKRSADDYPLRNFHKHDTQTTATPVQAMKNGKNADGIAALDEKLKAIEEAIIDDTLKFTGAHDDVDSKEMKVVKDSIITRLATAYNVEKMRKALSEYRQSLERRQKEWEGTGERSANLNAAIRNTQDKRVAVARKQAVDEDQKQDDGDNNIKCRFADDEDCNEQYQKVPREFIEQAAYERGCEKIERACKEVSMMFGMYGNVFQTACNMHQMCMLCSDNSWFSPTRQCNILFVAKADQLCEGDITCQQSARESIKYLQHVNRNMRSDLTACHLECPDKR